MKKVCFLSAVMAAVVCFPAQAEYATKGDFTTYTLDDLCAIEASGVVGLDGIYAITNDLIIAGGDSLKVNNAADIRILADATLTVEGYIELSSTDTIRVSNYDEGQYPRSIIIDGGCGVFSGVAFSGLGIYSWSEQPLTVEGCSFTGVTSASNSNGAVSFGLSSYGNVIRGCTFTANEVPAIGSAGTAYCGMGIYDCVLIDNNTANTNKPQINITTPATYGPTVISGNTIIGAERNMVGGISVSNLVGGDMGEVEISGNTIRDHRYGINIYGPLKAVLKDNVLVDNRYESNPMNGGSAISCTAFSGQEDVVISGNHIEGSLWGVTLISYGFLMPSSGYKGFACVSLGGPANSVFPSPGENVFVANGNDGYGYDPTTPYDLYNNTDQTVYAQNNTWSVPEQTEELVAEVIYDKADNPSLGEVIYMPTHAGIGTIHADGASISYDAAAQAVTGDSEVQIFTIDGVKVLSGHGTVSTAALPAGIYIAVSPDATLKFAIH
ncbi:MAG: hypothetical protein K2K37_08710 [Muribaculaceae bacterium]|nr:hypothetical protein [Muribaculaceae bacterium]